jgi:prephenate dehydrogenase
VKVALLGVGLIGGSIGLAARARADAEVCGYDPDADALRAGLRMGALDASAPDIPAAVAGAQVVFAAAPVGALTHTVREALAHAPADCVVSDVGSAKLALGQARDDPRFVGGHPLAGSEYGGVAHARVDLFVDATWYLTPADDTDPRLYERLSALIQSLGAHPVAIAAAAHDRLMASVSHLPHVLANVLAAQAADAYAREHARGGAGPSLSDAIRVAGANTAVWTDIYLANRDALIEAIDEAANRLDDVRAALTHADAKALAAWNDRAASARQALLSSTAVAQHE